MAEQNNRILYLSYLLVYPLFFFIAYYVASMSGHMVPFSAMAMIQPYLGENSLFAIVLGAVCIADVLVFHFTFIPQLSSNKANDFTVLAFPSVFVVFGFVIGFMNQNPWALIPYILLGLANYAYAYRKIASS